MIVLIFHKSYFQISTGTFDIKLIFNISWDDYFLIGWRKRDIWHTLKRAKHANISEEISPMTKKGFGFSLAKKVM